MSAADMQSPAAGDRGLEPDVLGRTREQLLATTCLAVTHSEERSAASEEMRLLREGTTDQVRSQARLLRPDGSVVWVASGMACLRAPGGGPLVNVAEMVDVTPQDGG